MNNTNGVDAGGPANMEELGDGVATEATEAPPMEMTVNTPTCHLRRDLFEARVRYLTGYSRAIFCDDVPQSTRIQNIAELEEYPIFVHYELECGEGQTTELVMTIEEMCRKVESNHQGVALGLRDAYFCLDHWKEISSKWHLAHGILFPTGRIIIGGKPHVAYVRTCTDRSGDLDFRPIDARPTTNVGFLKLITPK